MPPASLVGTSISILTNADDGSGDKLKPWDDPEVLSWARVVGVHVAPSIGGVPIQVELLNSDGKLKKVLPVADLDLEIGKDSLWYSGTATEAEARALGKALTEGHFFGGHGAQVLLDKSAGGTSVSFVLRDGAWNEPETVAELVQIATKAMPGIGGPPVDVYFLNTNLERKKTVVVGKKIGSAKGLPMLPGQD